MRFKLKGVAQTPYEMPLSYLQGEGLQYGSRSYSVTLTAIYQLFRAGVLFFVLTSLWEDSGVDLSSHAGFGVLVYLVTQRIVLFRLSPMYLTLAIVSALTAYYLATGVGLLFLRQWARRSVLFVSGVEIIRLIFVVWKLSYHHGSSLTITQQLLLSAFLFVDCVIIAALVNQSRSFGTSRFR